MRDSVQLVDTIKQQPYVSASLDENEDKEEKEKEEEEEEKEKEEKEKEKEEEKEIRSSGKGGHCELHQNPLIILTAINDPTKMSWKPL